MVGVYNGAAMLFYVNGVETYSMTQTGNLLSQTAAGTIGQFPGGYSPTTGSIDEVRIRNSAASSSNILAEYNNQSSPSTFYTLAGARTTAAALLFAL